MPLTPKRAGSVAYSLTMFVVVSMLAGLLVAGLIVPFAGIAGVSSRATAAEMDRIPAEFTTPPQPERSTIYMANGKKLATFYEQDRVYEPLRKIAPIMQKAQVAIEDHRFYEHGALDIKGTLRALVRNQAAGGVTQGGSSITQQYVKMVRIEKAQMEGDEKGIKEATAQTPARKIQELRYAIALEKQLTKDQILERYLNIAYYGDGSYGVEAAARHYFQTTAKKLTLPQAAMLAGLVQNPDGDNPVTNRDAAIARRNTVLNRMAELNVITAAQATAAKKTSFDEDKVKRTPNGCINSEYPFLCDYVLQSLYQDEALGKTVQDRKNAVLRGGLNIKTKIDPDAQDRAQKALSNYIGAKDPVISTMTEIQPGTGLIVAMAQNRPVMGSNVKKGETYFNYAATRAYSGGMGFQSGSTMKAVTMAAALEKGVPLTKRYNAPVRKNYAGYSWTGCDGTRYSDPRYTAKNSTGVNGNMDMRRAAEYSVNNYFLQLEHDVGVCDVTKMAKKLGLQRADGVDITKDSNSLAFTLGISDIAPMSLATAYATFAARGIRCDPIIIDKITNRNGKDIPAPSANCQRVISKDVADGVNNILQSVMKGRATGAPANTLDGRQEAGKTGTINNNKAVWFAGYTPELAGVAMIAIDTARSPFKGKHPRPGGVEGLYLPQSGTRLLGTGGGDAGRNIWRPAMRAALKDLPKTPFKNPSSEIRQGKLVAMPSIRGLSFAQAEQVLGDEGISLTRTGRYSSSTPRGQFMYYYPSSGKVAQYGTVYAIYSLGEDPAVKRARAQAKAQAKAEAAAKKRAEEKKKAAEEKKKAEEQKKKPGG